MSFLRKRTVVVAASVSVATCMIFGVLLYQGRLPVHTITTRGEIGRIRFSSDGNFLAAIVRGKNISVWNARNWQLAQTIPGAFADFYFQQDSRGLVTDRIYLPGNDLTAKAINSGEGVTDKDWKRTQNKMQEHLQTFEVESGRSTGDFVFPIGSLEAFAPKIHKAVLHRFVPITGISIIDTTTGHEDHFVHAGLASTARISPDGQWFAVLDRPEQTGSAPTGGVITLWSTSTWRHQIVQTPQLTEDVRFSPDGRYFGVLGPKSAELWHTADWKPYRTFTTNYDNSMQIGFTGDSSQIVTDGSWRYHPGKPAHTALIVWDISSGQKTTTLTNQEQISWRLTSRGIVTRDVASNNNILWDTKTGRRTWQGYAGYPGDAAVSPDELTLAVAHQNISHPNDGGIIEIRHLPKP